MENAQQQRHLDNVIKAMAAAMTDFRERQWIEKLYEEFAAICHQRSLRLHKPLIVIASGLSTWGSWESATRRISLSRSLISQYSWDFVCRIFEHELAHLIADEILGGDSGHGPVFQNACEMLGLPREFRSATVEAAEQLPHWRDDSCTDPEERRILGRVEKLLALADSANEHEAAAAMLRVHEILRKYNMDLREGDWERGFVRLTIDTQRRRLARTYFLIAGILSDHYGVRVIFASTFNAETCESCQALEILGTRQNVLMAEYVYHFLLNRIEVLWKRYQRLNRATASARTSYLVGLLNGFAQKMKQGSSAAQSAEVGSRPCGSLIRAEQTALSDYVHTQFPRLASRGSGRLALDANSYEAGRQEGRRISVKKGVGESGGQLFLPGRSG